MARLPNQIRARLQDPKAWRRVGFASASVGLLCYALSSSFNSLFGKWKLWKAFRYFVFSFIICIAVLCAKVPPGSSSSHRSKAHVAFLVLTITSFYSFFFDKAVTKKPDAYSVVSCAAFAVLSLSLSRSTPTPTDSGSEVDLLYFFLGALIVQLFRQCLSALNLQFLIDNDYENVGMATERVLSWLRASEIVVHVVFPNERRLCDRVFSDISLARSQPFMQICKEPTVRLLNFPKTFVVAISWPMICRDVLEVLRTLDDTIPELESLFHDQEVVTLLSNEAATTRKRLVEAIREVFKC